MDIMEKLGITKEKFKKIYDEHAGFNNIFNKNHPMYEDGEDFLAFLKSGCESLVQENSDIVID